MATNWYDRQLTILQERRAENPYWKAALKERSKVSGDFDAMNKDYQARLYRENAPEAAVAQQAIQAQKGVIAQQAGMLGQAQARDIERKDAMSNKMDELRLASAQFKEQQDEKKKAKKAEWWKTGLQLGGAAIGAALAIPTGGASLAATGTAVTAGTAGAAAATSAGTSMLMGAALGAGIGQAAGGLTAGMVVGDSDYLDTGSIMQGLGDAASAYSMKKTTESSKKALTKSYNTMDKINNLSSISERQEALRKFEILSNNPSFFNMSEADIYKYIGIGNSYQDNLY